jgi:hypothetical protein
VPPVAADLLDHRVLFFSEFEPAKILRIFALIALGLEQTTAIHPALQKQPIEMDGRAGCLPGVS